jgi:uncharacterized protein YndB with AHSA1/START domain
VQPCGCMKVEREITVDADPRTVWEALTEPGLLAEWIASDVELDLDEGHGVFRFEDGEERPAVIDEVDELERLSFRWRREGGKESRVEFRLEPAASGTRVVVIESAAERDDWGPRLEMLARHIARLVFA